MTATDFAAPSTANGFNWEEHLGALLILEPTALETDIPTSFGAKDAIRASISVVDGSDRGSIYDDVLVFPKALIGNLRPNIGKRVLGRVSQGVAKPGQKPPWLLDVTTPEDAAAARAFLADQPMAQPAATSQPDAATTTAAAGDDTPPAGFTAEVWAGLGPEAKAAMRALNK